MSDTQNNWSQKVSNLQKMSLIRYTCLTGQKHFYPSKIKTETREEQTGLSLEKEEKDLVTLMEEKQTAQKKRL